MPATLDFESKIFSKDVIDLHGHKEFIVRGGRDPLRSSSQGLRGRKADRRDRLGVTGAGPSPKPSLTRSREPTSASRLVYVRDRARWSHAREAGFDEDSGTLGEMYQVIRESDLVLLLISDGAQADLYPKVFEAIRPGATLGLSHGFLLGHLDNVGDKFPENINVIAVCPKGMGPSVRRLYVQWQGGQRSGDQRQLRRSSKRGRQGCRLRTGMVGGLGFSLHFPNHPGFGVQGPTSSASAASCWELSTASSRASTVATRARA